MKIKTVHTDIFWMFMESKQWIWAQLSTEGCILAMTTVMYVAMHSCHPLKWSSCSKIRELCTEENFDFSVLKLYYQYWDITKFMPGRLCKCSVKKRKFSRTCLSSIKDASDSFLERSITHYKMQCHHDEIESNHSTWNWDMQIPHYGKSSICSH